MFAKIARWVTCNELTVVTGAVGGVATGSQSFNNQGMYTITTSNVQGTYYYTGGIAFSLEDVPSYAELAATWQRYKMIGVYIRMIPTWNVTASQLPGQVETGLGGFIHSVFDPDDGTAPAANTASLAQFRQESQTYKFGRLSRGISRGTRNLKNSSTIYGGVTPAYSSQRPVWISMDTTDAQYWGFKWFIEVVQNSTTLVNLNFKLELRYVFAVQGPK